MVEKKAESLSPGFPALTLLALVISAVLYIFPEVASLFIFDRNAIAQGELWRLFSCHFVHFTVTHLAYNLLAFGVFGWVVERKNRCDFVLLYLFMAFAVSSSLFFLKPAMGYYGGLSGIACGYVFYCALSGSEKHGPWSIVCKTMMFLLPVKIVLELYKSASILPHLDQHKFTAMPVSHITGIAAAFLFYIAVKITGRYAIRRQLSIGAGEISMQKTEKAKVFQS